MNTSTSTSTSLTCEQYMSGRGVRKCGKPAVGAALRSRALAGVRDDEWEALCRMHLRVVERRNGATDELSDVVVANITKRLDEQRKAQDFERAKRAAEQANREALATQRALDEYPRPMRTIESERTIGHEFVETDADGVRAMIAVKVPTWTVVPRNDERGEDSWDAQHVELSIGWADLRYVEVRNASKLTPKQARALAIALMRAADVAEEAKS